jgi:hypothetical protein
MSDIECLSQDIYGVAAVVGVSEQGIVAVWTAKNQIDLSDSPGFSKDLGRVVDDFALFRCCAGKLVLLRIDVCLQGLDLLIAWAGVTLSPFSGPLEGVNARPDGFKVEEPPPHFGQI